MLRVARNTVISEALGPRQSAHIVPPRRKIVRPGLLNELGRVQSFPVPGDLGKAEQGSYAGRPERSAFGRKCTFPPLPRLTGALTTHISPIIRMAKMVRKVRSLANSSRNLSHLLKNLHKVSFHPYLIPHLIISWVQILPIVNSF
jgi:hypothetical protein